MPRCSRSLPQPRRARRRSPGAPGRTGSPAGARSPGGRRPRTVVENSVPRISVRPSGRAAAAGCPAAGGVVIGDRHRRPARPRTRRPSARRGCRCRRRRCCARAGRCAGGLPFLPAGPVGAGRLRDRCGGLIACHPPPRAGAAPPAHHDRPADPARAAHLRVPSPRAPLGLRSGTPARSPRDHRNEGGRRWPYCPPCPRCPPSCRPPRRRRRRGPRPDTAAPDAIVDCAAYIDGKRVPDCTDPVAAVGWSASARPRLRLGRPARTRTPTDGGSSPTLFGLHELAVEDAVQAYQRPKLDRYATSLFLVLKTVCYVEHAATGPRSARSCRTARSWCSSAPTSSSRSGTASHSPAHLRPRRAGGRPGAAGHRPGRRDARDRGPDRRRVRHRGRGGRGRHRRDGERRLHHDEADRHRADLPAQAGDPGPAPGGDAADARAAGAVRDAAPAGARGDPRVLPRRRGPPVGRRGTGDRPSTRC